MILVKDSGVYSLIIKLGKDEEIKVGSLGKIKFKKGIYVYTGSALSGLRARIERHKRKKKKLFWHIDYLLASRSAEILEVIAIRTKERAECKLNQIFCSLPNAKIIKNFGCSDCKCKSHLVYFSEESLKDLARQAFKLKP